QRVKTEILINAAPVETRVAVTEDGRLVEIFHERRSRRGLVGNVYLGRVQRVLPGMHAAFVSIGIDRQAFLYVEDALSQPGDSEFDSEENGSDVETPASASRPHIDDLVKEGQQIVVQVTK